MNQEPRAASADEDVIIDEIITTIRGILSPGISLARAITPALASGEGRERRREFFGHGIDRLQAVDDLEQSL